MTVRTIDEIFRDFVTDGVPASGPFNPHKPDIRDTLKALTEGSENFPDNRVIRLNNANEGTANNIVVTASVAIPAAAYQVLYILNVTQENTGPVTVSGAINRDLVTNINQPVPVGYLTPGMALLCIDTGSELRLLSYGDAETVAQAAEDAAARAEDAAAVVESAAGGLLSNFDTASAVAAANIQGPVNYARTAGYSTVGDGGAALYKRAGENPNYGPAVQTNGGFISDTDWTKYGAVAIQNGQCEFTGTANIRQSISAITSGVLVRVQYRISQEMLGGTVRAGLPATTSALAPTRTTPGTYVEYLVAPVGVTGVGFWTSGVTAGAIDDVVVNIVGAGQIQSADGAWWGIADRVLRPEMFGIKGDGSDETTLLQGMFDFAAGKEIAWPLGKTYGYTSLEIPNDVKLSGVGFTLRRLTASATHGVRINNWFRAEWLKISSPGGAGGDKAIRWQGSNTTIDYLHVEADAEGVDSSSNWAIEMESNPSGTTLSRNTIKASYCRNYSTFLFGKVLSHIDFSNVVIENFRTAVFLRDIAKSRFVNFHISGLGNAVNGGPGENGLLLEATASKAVSDIVFENWTVEDSGEHAYRLGGQRTIQNIFFNYCVAKRSGSSILSGNTSSGEWHGGCGFKVLGGGEVGGTRHKNIFFNQCEVYDVNQTFGTYPAGHGTNNFTPYMIVLADNVHLNNCLVNTEQLSTSCRNGILVGHSNGVYLNDCTFLKCNLSAIVPYQEAAFAGFPGYSTPLENFHVRGGLFEVTTAEANGGIVYYFREAATITNRRLTVKGAEFRGGAVAVRIETVGTGGAFNNCSADFSYNGPTSVTELSTSTPSFVAPTFNITAICEGRPNANNVARIGSMITEYGSGNVKLLKSTGWTTL